MGNKDTFLVADHIRRTLGDLQNICLGPEFNYASLPLCVIDAVYSIGVNYGSTSRTVKTWCTAHNPPWPVYRTKDTYEHSIGEFILLMRRYSFDDLASNVFKNRQRTSSRSGILKAEAVYRFADVLERCGVSKLGDTEDSIRNKELERQIREIPGQRSGISFTYFLMLAGSENFIKADRMVCRFVSAALRAPKEMDADEASRLVLSALAELKPEVPTLSPRRLDYAIWQYQRSTEQSGDATRRGNALS